MFLLASPRITYGVTTEDDHDDGTCGADCVSAADDLSGVICAADDTGYVTPANPDADGNGVVDGEDLLLDVARVFF